MKRNKQLIIKILIILMPFILLYVGVFLFDGGKEKTELAQPENSQSQESDIEEFPVQYQYRALDIEGHPQKIYTLEVDVADPKVAIKPVLSFDRVYGFERLSDMAKRNDAYAMINGGFFDPYGQPAGMIVIDGELVNNSTGMYPSFILSEGSAQLKEMKNTLWLESAKGQHSFSNINAPAMSGQMVVYTPRYGISNRLEGENITITIEQGRVKSIKKQQGNTNIPQNGFLISLCKPYLFDIDQIPFQVGESVAYHFEPFLGTHAQVYECGSWIVREGQVVIKDHDPWVGVLTNRDPRTAVGIKEDGTVLLLVVDGRQPGHSDGLTAKELGELFIELGVKEAAMLDGGASSEMIVEQEVVNKPSHKGKERPLAGGLMIQYKKT